MANFIVLLLVLLFAVTVGMLVWVSMRSPHNTMSVQLYGLKFYGPVLAFPAAIVGLLLIFAMFKLVTF